MKGKLTKKIGPLPVWAWLLVLVLGLAWRWHRARTNAQYDQAGSNQTDPNSVQYGPDAYGQPTGNLPSIGLNDPSIYGTDAVPHPNVFSGGPTTENITINGQRLPPAEGHKHKHHKHKRKHHRKHEHHAHMPRGSAPNMTYSSTHGQGITGGGPPDRPHPQRAHGKKHAPKPTGRRRGGGRFGQAVSGMGQGRPWRDYVGPIHWPGGKPPFPVHQHHPPAVYDANPADLIPGPTNPIQSLATLLPGVGGLAPYEIEMAPRR